MIMKTSIALLIWMLPVVASAQGQPSLVSVTLDPATVTGGASSTATITLSGPARGNGFDVTFLVSSLSARVALSTITIPDGRSSETVRVDTGPVATRQFVILNASARGETRSAAITILPPAVSSITAAPSSLRSGENSTATITLTGNAPSDGFPVSLSTNNAALRVPASVSVAPNQRTLNVLMLAGTVAGQTSVTLAAAADGISKATTLTVAPVPVRVTSFEYPPNPVSGQIAARTITLDAPALSGGALVQVSWSGANMLQAEAPSVIDTIPEGRMSITKRNKVPLTSSDRPFELTATHNGASIRRTGTLKPPAIMSLSIADSLFEGTTAMLVASLNGEAPATGLPVAIKSDNPSAISSPGEVSFSGGASATYQVRANDVSSRTPVTLIVNQNGVVKTVSTTVVPRVIQLTGFTVTPSSVRGGQSVTITATINVPAPPSGTVVQLVEFPGLQGFDVPTTLLIPAGATSKSVTVAAPRIALVSLWTDVKASLDTRSLDRMRFSVRVTVNP